MKLLPLICLIISGILYSGTHDTKHQLLFLLPLIYGISFYYCGFFRKNVFKYLSLFILFTTSFMRYVVTPFVVMLGGFDSNASNYGISLFKQAILMMGYEEVLFFVVVKYFAQRFFTKATDNKPIDINKTKSKGVIVIIIIAIILIGIFPVLISRFHFVPTITGNEYEDVVENNLSGGFGLFVTAARYFFIVLLLQYFYKKYTFSSSNKYIYYSIILIGLSSLIVVDLSRFAILQPVIAFIYFLILLYPSAKKKIFSLTSVFMLFSLIYTTFVKMFSEARGGDENINDIASWGNTFQVYFQNVSDVVIGIAASEKMPLNGLYAFTNDVFSNTAIISAYSITRLTSLHIFNIEYSGGISFDKILPNVCAGYNYLGVIGAPIITLLFCILGMWFDAESRKTDDLYLKFIFIFAAVTCSLPHMVYYTMLVGALINMILVMYLLIKLNNKF